MNDQPSRRAQTRRAFLRGASAGAVGLLLSPLLQRAVGQQPVSGPAPNIIVMMVDDMGYSDLSCFGSEIATPNLDAVAAEGVRITNFHNTARCCPSRASILTGLHPQQTGMGYMVGGAKGPNQPGYTGSLSKPHVTLANVLERAGYSTAISGKWHLNPGDPKLEGFERTEYHEVRGSRSYFAEVPEKGRGNEKFAYITDWFGDGVCDYIGASAGKKPFFIYWTPTAPHYPLHAKVKDIEKHKGAYKAGPQAVAAARYQRMVKLGIIDATWPYTVPDEVASPDTEYRTDVRTDADPYPPAGNLVRRKSSQLQSSRPAASFEEMMEIYAAMVDGMDQNVGKVIAKLKETGQYENTLILFCADNGASPEGEAAGKAWGQVSDTPFRKWKMSTYGGGNRTSCIVSWPKRVAASAKGSINRTYGHLLDVMPTVLDAASSAGAKYPAKDSKGRDLPALEGKSLLPVLEGKRVPMPRPLCFEHRGNLAVITEEWKIVSDGGEPWRLYSMRSDPLERNDVAKDHPDLVKRMARQWQEWADRVDARANSNNADDSKARIKLDSMTP